MNILMARAHGALSLPSSTQTVRHPLLWQAAAGAAGYTFSDFIPAEISEIQEPAALELAAALRRMPLHVPSLGADVSTAFAGPSSEQLAAYPHDAPAFILLHAFDSNSLEFRRLYPLLARHAPTYTVDLVGEVRGGGGCEGARQGVWRGWAGQCVVPLAGRNVACCTGRSVLQGVGVARWPSTLHALLVLTRARRRAPRFAGRAG